jgi:hypothetical protein
VTKAIGLMLTIAGLILAIWFVRIVLLPNLAPLQAFVVGAIALAMVSVGVRYILKGSKKKKPKTEGPQA